MVLKRGRKGLFYKGDLKKVVRGMSGVTKSLERVQKRLDLVVLQQDPTFVVVNEKKKKTKVFTPQKGSEGRVRVTFGE